MKLGILRFWDLLSTLSVSHKTQFAPPPFAASYGNVVS